MDTIICVDNTMKVLNLLPIVLLLAFTSQDTFAHTDHDKARFVAVDGVDQGKCDNRFRPCQSIAYAARQANNGDKVLVATGEYVFDSAQHAQVLNDSLMPVFGGFSRIDHYQTQNPTINKTTLIKQEVKERNEIKRLLYEAINRVKNQILESLKKLKKLLKSS